MKQSQPSQHRRRRSLWTAAAALTLLLTHSSYGAVAPSPGYWKFEAWDSLDTGDNSLDSTLLADPRYPASPTTTSFTSRFDSRPVYPNDSHEGYGGKISGWLTPLETGSYDFFLRSDDSSRLFISTDDKPANLGAAPIAEQSGCCNAFAEPGVPTTTAAPIDLVAGKRYYIEAVWKEGTGGDYLQVAWRKATDTTPAASLQPIPGAVLSTEADPAGATVNITKQPTSATVLANEPVTFTVEANATSPYVTAPSYQWFKNDAPIAGASGASYTIPVAKAADNGAKFKVAVRVPGLSKDSDAATLTVNTDTSTPKIVGVRGNDAFNAVIVTYSEPVDPATGASAANYSIAPALTVSKAELKGDRTVVLATGAQAIDTAYTLTVKGVKDSAGNAIAAADGTVAFRSFLLLKGLVKFNIYNDLSTGDNNIDTTLLADQRYIDNKPDVEMYGTATDSRTVYADDSHEGYGASMETFLTPAESASYFFFIRSDDSSRLFISTDDKPANAVQVAEETGCCNAFQEPGDPKTSAAIPMVTGKRYYVKLIWKEGTGGDFAQLAWRKEADTTAAATLSPIKGDILSWYVDPKTGPPVITVPPQSVAVDLGGSATFTVTVGSGREPLAYQWLHNGIEIPGATQATYTINNVGINNVVGTDDLNSGRNQFTVTVSNADGAITSAPGMLFFKNTLFIEAEDFNYGGGKTITNKPIGMTGAYGGGDFAGLGTDADQEIDYNANGANSQPYRPDSLVSAGKPNQHPDGLPRGEFDVKVNHVVGWNDGGEWYNYTRQFPSPAKDYYVVGRLASGGAALRGQLDEVNGATTANQTIVRKLGEFNPGRATAAWDTMEFFPLVDDNGQLAKVNIGGEKTIRFTVAQGAAIDQDYFMFIPAAQGTSTPGFTSVARNGTNLVLTWASGTLETADAVTGPWTASNATSPATIQISGTAKFYRLK
ncbi:MAG: PA14 domain-containing protein [Verrucomicrobiota bacterium]